MAAQDENPGAPRAVWRLAVAAILFAPGCVNDSAAPGGDYGDELDGPDALLDRIASQEAVPRERLEPLPNAERLTLRELLEQIDPALLGADLEAYHLESELDQIVPVFMLEVDEPHAEHSSTHEGRTLAAHPRAVANGNDVGVPAGDVGCATVTLGDPDVGASIPLSPEPYCSVVTDTTTSPDVAGPYYGPTLECPLQYVTEVTGTIGRELGPTFSLPQVVSTADPYASQGACESIRVDVTTFGALLAFPPQLVWTKLGTAHYHGVWRAGLFSTCTFEPTGRRIPPTIDEDDLYFKVRTAARAYEAGDFYWFRPVEVGVGQVDGPC